MVSVMSVEDAEEGVGEVSVVSVVSVVIKEIGVRKVWEGVLGRCVGECEVGECVLREH